MHRAKQVKPLCNHPLCLKEKHTFLTFIFQSCQLRPGSHCVCDYALKNKVLRSCVPSYCHADSPSTSELPAKAVSTFCSLCLQKLAEMKAKMNLWRKPQQSGLQVLLRNAQKTKAWWLGSDQEPQKVVWMMEENG